ncbi:hypothetical protein [Solitalea lacus]|uniref:hypothetical protein n=1 Tax=Solitalea lacus TaxID=2911172 RepID=UPI001EDC07BE|nr:hypothetical protein [Solitalea lacus]UKJ09230.1 hypothetical protein L2B55_08745 [Solitalea lacus]
MAAFLKFKPQRGTRADEDSIVRELMARKIAQVISFMQQMWVNGMNALFMRMTQRQQRILLVLVAVITLGVNGYLISHGLVKTDYNPLDLPASKIPGSINLFSKRIQVSRPVVTPEEFIRIDSLKKILVRQMYLSKVSNGKDSLFEKHQRLLDSLLYIERIYQSQ